jgi:hypothetical protein
MPKEIRGPNMTKERIEWALANYAKYEQLAGSLDGVTTSKEELQ